ncbi:unnamed protein product [Prorocentrum cordatum]|uniref:CDP-diacylglycerol--glycerol-3-phosphate 3-phosphatidyltransferase n=1 Tax=Prorocentrum cordatum TaxID=2364126 RepID=A0ABN9UFC0_9DINO|nr:unnamed protein product [Polarella glacialis]
MAHEPAHLLGKAASNTPSRTQRARATSMPNVRCQHAGAPLAAAGLFGAAAATDALDGYLARRWGQTTSLGALLDPLADKLLVTAALLVLVEHAAHPAVTGPAVAILFRELSVSGLREWAQFADGWRSARLTGAAAQRARAARDADMDPKAMAACTQQCEPCSDQSGVHSRPPELEAAQAAAAATRQVSCRALVADDRPVMATTALATDDMKDVDTDGGDRRRG